MNNIQYDLLHKYMVQAENKLNILTHKIETLSHLVGMLCSKTLVVTDVNKDIAALKQEIKQLKDEVNI